MPVTRFEELAAWQRSRDLALGIYRVTANERFARDFGLRDQIRRAAVSVMSNVAEGFERYSRREFKQFISIARGSVAEVRSQLLLARDLKYLSDSDFTVMHALAFDISRMLAALHTSLGSR
ncbi:MAG TPA: four helix bundle protein [Longimicrobiaceae bacterium]|nr:four helix bundle protein [Longimicrobiaceae bacterium]